VYLFAPPSQGYPERDNLARTNPRWARYAGYSDGTVSASAEDVVAVPEAAYELPPSLLAWPEPELPYRHQFEPEELPAAVACVRDHGFAVIKVRHEPGRLRPQRTRRAGRGVTGPGGGCSPCPSARVLD